MVSGTPSIQVYIYADLFFTKNILRLKNDVIKGMHDFLLLSTKIIGLLFRNSLQESLAFSYNFMQSFSGSRSLVLFQLNICCFYIAAVSSNVMKNSNLLISSGKKVFSSSIENDGSYGTCKQKSLYHKNLFKTSIYFNVNFRLQSTLVTVEKLLDNFFEAIKNEFSLFSA